MRVFDLHRSRLSILPTPSKLSTLAILAVSLAAIALTTACSDAPPLYEDMPEHVRTRHVALEGAANFRDLGGYETRDGRHVKWNTFYRSDNLAHLTDSDLETLGSLDIALVCDFRSPQEREEDPDRLPETNTPEVAYLEIWDPSLNSATIRESLSGGNDSIDLGELLVEGNRMFATKFSDRYRSLFERITRPENLPALVHCTGGKDRAGFASALILRLLDVPMETIYDDFLLTNHYTAERIEEAILILRAMSFFRMDEDSLRAVLGVERRFLEAGFDEIEREYGSFETYRRDILGISDEKLLAFRALGLE